MSTDTLEPQGPFEDIQLSDNSDINSEASYDIVSNAGFSIAQKTDAEDVELNTNGTSEEIGILEEYQDLESNAETERFRLEIENKTGELLDMVLSSSACETILSDDDNPCRAKARELVALFGDDIEENAVFKVDNEEFNNRFADLASEFENTLAASANDNDAITQENERLRRQISNRDEAKVKARNHEMNVWKKMNDEIESSRAEVGKLKGELQDERACNNFGVLDTERFVSAIEIATEASEAKVQELLQKAKQAEQKLVEAKILANLETIEFEQKVKREVWYQHQANSWKESETQYKESINTLTHEKDNADLRCKLAIEDAQGAKNHAGQCEKRLQDFQDRASQLQQRFQEKVKLCHNKAVELTRESNVHYEVYKEKKEFAEKDSRTPFAESVKAGEQRAQDLKDSRKAAQKSIDAAKDAYKTYQLYEQVLKQQSVLVPTPIEPVTESPKSPKEENNAAQAIGPKPEEKKDAEEAALPIRQPIPVASNVEVDTIVKAATATNSQQGATAHGKDSSQAVEPKADREAESKEKEPRSVRGLDTCSEPLRVNAKRKAIAMESLEAIANIPSPKVSLPVRPAFHLDIANLNSPQEEKQHVGKASREVNANARRQALVMQQLNTPEWQNAIFQHIQPVSRTPKAKAKEEKKDEGNSVPVQKMAAHAELMRNPAAEKKAKISEPSGQEPQEEKKKHIHWSNPNVQTSEPYSTSTSMSEQEGTEATYADRKTVAIPIAIVDPSKPTGAKSQVQKKNHNLDTLTDVQKAEKYWIIRNNISRGTADKYLKLAFPDSCSEEFIKGYPEANPNPES